MRRSCIHFARCGASLAVSDRHVLSASRGLRGMLKSTCLSPPHSRKVPILSENIPKLPLSYIICRHYSIDNLKPENANERKSVVEECLDVNKVPKDESDPHPGSINEPEEDLFYSIDYDSITGGDHDVLNKFKLLLLEVDVLRQDGMRVPSKLSTDQWKELFSLKSKSQRLKYLSFLWISEIKKINDKSRKEKKRTLILEKRLEEVKENENNGHIRYGFQGCTIFTRIYDTTINLFDNSRLIQAMMFGQNVILDCAFDKVMSIQENKLCAKQLTYLFAENRLSQEPFNIHFCNVNKSGILYKQFCKHIPTIEDPGFPINISEQHYLELFPKERLVYLTPHCREDLKQYCSDDIYIVGALVDRQITEPLSLAKAKSEGIRMARFPLERYLDWGIGTKSLTINQVMSILLDLKNTGDWNIALRNVPRRKLRPPGEPLRDTRTFYNRGTICQPLHHVDRRRRHFEPVHYSSGNKSYNERRQEENQQRPGPRKTSY